MGVSQVYAILLINITTRVSPLFRGGGPRYPHNSLRGKKVERERERERDWFGIIHRIPHGGKPTSMALELI